MDAQYKGFDVLMDALVLLRERGIAVELTLVGDGRFRPMYQEYAARRNLLQWVTFRGHLPAGEAIRRELDAADCFILASKSEGLPRAMIEAMARGLPCIGTRVGGIPELLREDSLVDPNDPKGLWSAVLRLLQNPDHYFEHSVNNLARAREYDLAVLGARRKKLYSYLQSETTRWCMRTSGAAVQANEPTWDAPLRS
jgi:glycosyltransferase involved in cell wall biosynthesis